MEAFGHTAGSPRSSASSMVSVLLSAGVPAGRKTLGAVLIAISIVVLLPLGILVGSALSDSSLEALAVGGPIVLGLLGLVLLAAILWGLCNAIRNSAYLRGTKLIVRKAFRTQRADLATAQTLRLSKSPGGISARAPIPTLEVSEDAQRRSATMHFGLAQHGYIPQYEVQALTAAIRAGYREGLSAQHAEYTVYELQKIAR